MKNYFLICLLFVILFSSCSSGPNTRDIEISIPYHQWEKSSAKSMWYTVKWTFNQTIRTLRLNSQADSAIITIPLGETVYVCAYPLDELNPLGVIINPDDTGTSFVLDSNSGILSGYLINIDQAIRSRINSKKLYENAKYCTDDFRNLNFILLLKDILNGELSEKSFTKQVKTPVPSLVIPNGYWIAENSNDPSFTAEDEMTPTMYLPYGTYAWYCPNLDLEFFICIDSEGNISSSTREAKLT